MEKYNAWIKELSTIVYDNSKSEYQILSELIPILLNIKSSQDTNSELMDTIHDTVFNKVNELESGMNTFTETFIGKLNEFKQEFTPQLEEFTNTLESNISEFKEKINNKISTFNTTYASEKASIQTIANSINNINDTLISGYNEILDNINNFVELIINSSSGNIIDNAIEEKFTPTYLARESIYIDLVSVTTQPSSANEGDIYYNASEYQLYKYISGAWVKEEYVLNKIYRYQNNIYLPQLIKYNAVQLANYYQQPYCLANDYIITANNTSSTTKMQITKININGNDNTTYSNLTLPDDYTNMTDILYNNYNNTYYMLYYNTSSLNYRIATSTDLKVWTKLTELNDTIIRPSIAFFINDDIYIGNKKYSNGSWETLPYMIFYSNGYYFWGTRNIYRSTTPDLDTSEEHLYIEKTDYSDISNTNIVYYNPDKELLLYANDVFLNKEIGSTYSQQYKDYLYENDNLILIDNYVLYHNHYLYFRNTVGGFPFGNILIDRGNTATSTSKYSVALGLVAYE